MIHLVGADSTTLAKNMREDQETLSCLTVAVVGAEAAVGLSRDKLPKHVQDMSPTVFKAWFIQQILPEVYGYRGPGTF